uniref:Uncharacterized protein n=1 Tax=Acrobeloides nanus TaxID=290746 RepID=A0A914ELN8_9BILA
MHSPIRSLKDWNNPDRLTIAHPAPEAVFIIRNIALCLLKVLVKDACKFCRGQCGIATFVFVKLVRYIVVKIFATNIKLNKKTKRYAAPKGCVK